MFRHTRGWAASFLVAALSCMALTLPAKALTEKQIARADSFALGNAAWILYHEIGHLLVNEFRLPVLGREEDAVDHLATITLLEVASPETDGYLIDAVDGFFLSARAKRQDDLQRLYFAGHGLDEQRAFEVACLMLGNDSAAFTPLADSINLPRSERSRCPHAYRLARSSWKSVLEPASGGWLDNLSQQDVTFSYGRAGEKNAKAMAILKDGELLEAAAEYLGHRFVFPRQILLRSEECGESNAFFEPGPGNVVLCYELVEEFRTLLTKYYEGF